MRLAKLSVVALALACAPAVAQTTPAYWNEGTVIGVHDDDANILTPIFFNTWTGAGISSDNPSWPGTQTYPRSPTVPDGQNPEVWTTIDLTGFIPSDAVGVFLNGIMIITGDDEATIKDLHLAFRPYGGTLSCESHSAQALASAIALDSARSNFAIWVPVEDSKFEFCWKLGVNDTHTPTTSTYPSYGLNVQLRAFTRTARQGD